MLRGHEEFFLADAVDGVANASKCDKCTLLIGFRGNPYEISSAGIGHHPSTSGTCRLEPHVSQSPNP